MRTLYTANALTRRALTLGCGALCTVALAACANGEEVDPASSSNAGTMSSQSSSSSSSSSSTSSTSEASESASPSKSMSPQVRSGGVPRIGQPCPGRAGEMSEGANGQLLQCADIGDSLMWSALPDNGNGAGPQPPSEGTSPSESQPPSSDSSTPGTPTESPAPTDGSTPSNPSQPIGTDNPEAPAHGNGNGHGNQHDSNANKKEPNRPNQSGSTPEQELQLLFRF